MQKNLFYVLAFPKIMSFIENQAVIKNRFVRLKNSKAKFYHFY